MRLRVFFLNLLSFLLYINSTEVTSFVSRNDEVSGAGLEHACLSEQDGRITSLCKCVRTHQMVHPPSLTVLNNFSNTREIFSLSGMNVLV